MAERSNGKKSTSGTTLDLMGDEETAPPRAARKAAAPAPAQAAPAETGGALVGGDEVDLGARHPADVPVGNFPAPSQIAQVAQADEDAADPFAEDDPFEDTVMARMLADEPAPLSSPLRAAREEFNLTTDDRTDAEAPAEELTMEELTMEEASMPQPFPVAETAPDLMEAAPMMEAAPDVQAIAPEPEAAPVVEAAIPMMEAGPDVEAFADPAAVPEVEQSIEPPTQPKAEQKTETPMPAGPAMPTARTPAAPKNAGAKNAKTNPVGLTMSRRYTQPGQDIWTTVEWELRTASIIGSDGTVVFEQKGVEIPKAWSQLATNVVVSKYFRGQIGTLEREYSVKQLIGRVADRILEWGNQGGYFAADADADAFHDELRYILLHQYAAFNSPVWFNLGWSGRKQAASACYINEVDDTMESILDLYKTEGMLFKDGSGSGLNLSTLRSSKEPLEAGGRSSGPISFMKGLDASAGSIKSGGSCLAPWTRVYTERGPVAVSDLVGKDFIALSYDPPAGRFKAKRAQAWHAGTKRVVRLTTDKGQFDLSYDHPVRLADGRYVPCEQIRPGQSLFHCKVDEQMGYVRVGLRRGRRDSEQHRKLHQLIAEDVLGWDLHGMSLHHRDEDKHNNDPTNLSLMAQADHAGLHSRTQMAEGSQVFQNQRFSHTGQDNGMAVGSAFWQDTEKADRYRQVQGRALRESGRAPKMHADAMRAKMLNKAYAVLSEGLSVDTPEDYFHGCIRIGRRCPSKAQFLDAVQNNFGGYEAFLAELKVHNHRAISVETLGVMDVYDVEVDCPTADDKSPQTGHNFVIWPDDSRFGTGIAVANTRRAACMRVLDIDHPDVKEFIDCKKDAEEKAHALIDAGYSGAFNVAGGAYDTVPFQNANHSVRVTDAFMQAVEADAAWDTKFRLSGHSAETFRARDLMRGIAEGTWTCLPPGELILTETGERPIETLEAGDRVWTHKGRLARVDHTMARPFTGDLVEINVNGYHRMLVTDNHPVLVANYKGKADFRPAEEVSAGDYVMIPNFRPSDKRKAVREPQTTSFLRLLGYYLAEGSVEDDRGTPATVRFTFHVKEADYTDDVLSLIKEAFDKTASVRVMEARNVREVVVCSREIAATFVWLCGRGASGKRLNEDLFTAYDSASLLEMVDTWLRGDGHDRMLNKTHRQLTGRTVSERLARDMFRILVMNRLKPTMRCDMPEGKKPVYSVSLFGRCAGRFYDRVPRGRGYLRYKVQAVRRVPYEGKVYNLNLDRDSTFLTNFFVVHNCGDPGMQYDTTINDWHTCADTDRIYASNPCCFVGETLIETAEGQVPFAALYMRHEAGEVLPSVFSFERHNRRPVLRSIRKVWIAGHTQHLVEVKTERGLTFRCTPEHRFLTQEGTYVEAQHLSTGTALCSLRCAAKDLPENKEALQAMLAEAADVLLAVTPLTLDAPVPVYDMEVEDTHNFAITDARSAGQTSIVVSNSEFMFLNSTACNLSSLNLMKFRQEGTGAFDTESFEHAVAVMITAQEIVVGFASYPTPKIEQRSHEYRPLGLGYANLGALLMAAGLPYDSDAGRAYAGAVTALMTGRAYHQSAAIARDCGGPFSGFAPNRASMLRVMGKHRAAVDDISPALIPDTLLAAARTAWDEAVAEGQASGYRNAQASVLAPTGCLVAGSLVVTDRGVVRLNRLGDVNGAQWQEADFGVLTDEGRRQATKFYVNGWDETRRVTTHCGYAIQGTPKHRIKVVDAQTGRWDWKRFADIAAGDIVPLSLGQMIGEAQAVALPPLGEEYWTGDYATRVPRTMTADLAELIGYFMGDGSMHSKGPRFCVANTDLDVAERVKVLVKSLFNLDAHLTPQQGYCEVAVHSVPLTLWWEACGFSKAAPGPDHSGKGYLPRIPDAILATNDPAVYGAFLRGLYEADGTVTGGIPCWSTVHREFSDEVKTLLLALGVPTTTRRTVAGWSGSPIYVLRLRNTSYTGHYLAAVGFMGARKAEAVSRGQSEQTARHDYVYLSPAVLRELLPRSGELANALLLAMKRHEGAITRRAAQALLERTGDSRLAHALRFFYDAVTANEDGGEQLTYDLSVPGNVTYVANGFVSHNTIGFLMDCDTTGIEPDIAIVKYKSLVGGGMMKIVNQTVPEALQRLGYDEAQVEGILKFIDEHDTVEGAPDLKPEHLPIFDCAFRPMNGTRSIHYRGHIKMMAAAQPFISGAISKTCNVPNDATPEEIADVYMDAWKLGIKAVAIYRDGSKRTQPLNTSKEKPAPDKTGVAASPAEETAALAPPKAVRRRLPDERAGVTHKFSIGGHEGYLTVGLYPDTNQPGEIFIRMSKEGSSISGLMDSFATAISLALQYGVPLSTLVDKFIHSRFEPSGFTGNKEIPMAKSVMDYIFRYLALRFLQKEDRHNVGLLADQDDSAYAAPAPAKLPAPPPAHDANSGSLSNGKNGNGSGSAPKSGGDLAHLAETNTAAITDHEREIYRMQSDAPPCPECGAITIRSGACYKCLSCGTSLGCS